MKLKFLLLGILLFFMHSSAGAQHVALKTNLISDALLNPQLGLEARLASKWSLEIAGQVNFWTVDGHKWRHAVAQPELRYWFCRAFTGHFLGLHGIGGKFNVGNLDLDFDFLGLDMRKLKDRRYEGWLAGAGLAYGYAWPVHPHWNIEAEIGVGWIYNRYDAYPCAQCGTRLESDKSRHYFGPTKAAINIVYLF